MSGIAPSTQIRNKIYIFLKKGYAFQRYHSIARRPLMMSPTIANKYSCENQRQFKERKELQAQLVGRDLHTLNLMQTNN